MICGESSGVLDVVGIDRVYCIPVLPKPFSARSVTDNLSTIWTGAEVNLSSMS